MKTLNKTTEIFLNYSFYGNGKYYTTEQGSRSYRNTTYKNFASKNPHFFKVISIGNDAPRGGMTGTYEVVKFTPEFLELAKRFQNEKKAKEQAIIDAKKNENILIVNYASLIDKIEGEDYAVTAGRLSAKLDSKIDSKIFHKAVKMIRNRKKD